MSREELNEFVDIQISRETQIIDGENFKNVLFISEDKPFFERVRLYGSISSMLADGFTSTDNAYKAAVSAFSQTPRPNVLYIGRRDYTDSVITFDAEDILGSTDYAISMRATDGTTITDFSAVETSGVGTAGVFTGAAKVTEVTRIIDAWETAINASPIASLVTVTKTTSSITLTPTGASDELGVLSITEGLIRTSTYETWPTTLAAIEQENDDWYCVTTYSSELADITAIASEIETRKKIYGYSATNAAIKAAKTVPTDVTDTMGLLEDLTYDRTFGTQNDPLTEYIETAWAGKKLQAVAGSTTWNFTVLSGVTPNSLSITESKNIRDKNGNTYQTIAGQNIMREGKMASGEFIDVIHGADDLESRIQTEVYRLMLVTANGGSKVAYTDSGLMQIKNVIETEIRRSVAAGFIKATIDTEDAAGQLQTISGYSVLVPLASSASENDREQRIAPIIKFNAVLASAVHKTVIRGSITV